MYQLSLFGDTRVEGKPQSCPECGARLGMAHPAFTLTSSYRGFYEVYCEGCGRCYRLYCNSSGEPNWALKSPRQDPTWCVEERFN